MMFALPLNVLSQINLPQPALPLNCCKVSKKFPAQRNLTREKKIWRAAARWEATLRTSSFDEEAHSGRPRRAPPRLTRKCTMWPPAMSPPPKTAGVGWPALSAGTDRHPSLSASADKPARLSVQPRKLSASVDSGPQTGFSWFIFNFFKFFFVF